MLVRFLLGALVPLLALGAIAIHIFSRSLQTHIQNKLIAISDGRAALLGARLDSMAGFITERSLAPTPVAAFEKLSAAFKKGGLRSQGYQIIDSQYREDFQQYLDIHDYLYDLIFVSPEGDVVFTMQHEKDLGENIHGSLLKNTPLAGLVDLVSTSLSTEFSDFDFYRPSALPALFVAAPAFAKGRLLGVLVAQIKPEVLMRFARNYTGLPKTGEIVFAKQAGAELVYTTPFRSGDDAPLSQRVRLGSDDDFPMQAALRGDAGIGLSTDRKGTAILARWQYIPRLRWGMVVKVDAAEIFASLNDFKRTVWLLCALLALGITLIALRTVGAIAIPLNELKQGVEIVGRGNLDYKTRLELRNEIGELSQAFDKMTEDLKTQTASRSALEKEMAERSRAEKELARQNQELKTAEAALLNLLEDLGESKDSLENKNKDLEAMKTHLERSNKELEDFAYVVSHDLKAPLRGISSLSTWIETDYADKLDAEGRHQLQLLKQRAVRMDQLISGILQYSRIHRMQEDSVPTELDGLLDEAIEMVNPPRGIRIIRDSRLPRVKCSPTRIKQVFQNLVDNAVKYMGKETGEIKVSCLDKNDHWQFCVADDGQGIAEKHFDKIFKIFHTVAQPGQTQQGTGIGLALVQKAVTLHDGTVWVESQVGAGSRFFFTLPKTA